MIRKNNNINKLHFINYRCSYTLFKNMVLAIIIIGIGITYTSLSIYEYNKDKLPSALLLGIAASIMYLSGGMIFLNCL